MLYFEFGIVLLALWGAYLNAKGDRNGFIFWIFTNSFLAAKNFSIHEYAQGTLFLAYLALALYGYITWHRKA